MHLLEQVARRLSGLVSRLLGMLMYVCLFLAGMVFITWPTTSTVQEQTGFVGLLLWHFFLLVGAGWSTVFAALKKPLMEAAGIWPQAAAIAIYAVTLFTKDSDNRGTATGIGFVFLALVLGLMFRFAYIFSLMKIESALTQREGRS